jgi:hypothetical protein
VVIGYKTCELHITSFVKNNKFWAVVTSFLTKIMSILTKMTIKTNYVMEITIKLVIEWPNSLYSEFDCHFRVLQVILVTHELYLLLNWIRPYRNKSCFAGP